MKNTYKIVEFLDHDKNEVEKFEDAVTVRLQDGDIILDWNFLEFDSIPEIGQSVCITTTLLTKKKTCQRCGSSLMADGLCPDKTCPFSNHFQHCPIGWVGYPERTIDEMAECVC